jgi:hypothetical protein
MIKSVWNGQGSFRWIFLAFVAVGALGASAAFYGAFFVLCAIECTALPWLTFIIGPAVSLLVVLPTCIWLGVGSFRAANQLAKPAATVAKVAVGSSLLWLSMLSGMMFMLVLKGMQGLT